MRIRLGALTAWRCGPRAFIGRSAGIVSQATVGIVPRVRFGMLGDLPWTRSRNFLVDRDGIWLAARRRRDPIAWSPMLEAGILGFVVGIPQGEVMIRPEHAGRS